MKSIYSRWDKNIRIPFRVVKKQIEFYYGGALPKLREGTVGDIVVAEEALDDPAIVEFLQREHAVPFVDKNPFLLMGVVPDEIPETLRQHIIKTYEIGNLSGNYGCLVEVWLTTPLHLKLHASKKASLCPCACVIPSLGVSAQSLNHAYTQISQAYEPRRLSHAGNVFQLTYAQRGNRWWLLDDLRSYYEAIFESACTFQILWKLLSERAATQSYQMTLTFNSSELSPDEQQIITFLWNHRTDISTIVDTMPIGAWPSLEERDAPPVESISPFVNAGRQSLQQCYWWLTILAPEYRSIGVANLGLALDRALRNVASIGDPIVERSCCLLNPLLQQIEQGTRRKGQPDTGTPDTP